MNSKRLGFDGTFSAMTERRLRPPVAGVAAGVALLLAAPAVASSMPVPDIVTGKSAADADRALAGGAMMGIGRGTCLVRELRSQVAHLRRGAGTVAAASRSAPLAASGSPEVEAARRAAAGPVKGFIEWIYSRFLLRGGGPPVFSALETPEHIFEPELASAVRRIMLAGERAGGVYDISDPFMPGNDYDTTAVNIRVIEETPRTAMVAVSFRNFGKPIELTIDLVRGDQGWRARDVVGEGYAFRAETLADAR